MLSSTCLSSPRPSASRIAISCRPARGADRWTCAKGKPCVAFAVSRPEGWLFVGDGDHRLVQQVGNCHGPVTFTELAGPRLRLGSVGPLETVCRLIVVAVWWFSWGRGSVVLPFALGGGRFG